MEKNNSRKNKQFFWNSFVTIEGPLLIRRTNNKHEKKSKGRITNIQFCRQGNTPNTPLNPFSLPPHFQRSICYSLQSPYFKYTSTSAIMIIGIFSIPFIKCRERDNLIYDHLLIFYNSLEIHKLRRNNLS